MNASQSPFRLRFLALCAVGAFAVASPAIAAKTGKRAVDEQYKADVALCNSGKSVEGKKTCLYEASSARAERARNRLAKSDQDYQANAVQRCRALPAGDQDACVASMSGQGKTYGSVASGGILREITIQVPADQAGQPTGAGQPVSPAPGGYATPPASGGYQPAPAPAPMPAPAGSGTPGTGLRY